MYIGFNDQISSFSPLQILIWNFYYFLISILIIIVLIADQELHSLLSTRKTMLTKSRIFNPLSQSHISDSRKH